MKAYVFPGQGAQFSGMGKDLYDHSEHARSLFARANEILGFDIQSIMFEGTDEALKQTNVTQPAIFLHSTILAACLGERVTLTVYGERQEQHRLLIDHLAAERPNKTSGQGRELWEWKSAPGRDNHWLDCLSLAGVGASMLGCSLDRVINGAAPFQKKVSFSELQRLQRERKQKV
jgi:hypothetical protein